jgi:hypothetical protein
MRMDIGKTIEALRGSDNYIEAIFTQGGCYQFHLFLKTLYPNAKPMLSEDKEHVVSLIDGRYYDITGEVNEFYEPMTPAEIKEAETWSFSRTQFLSLGECAHCEEPLLIEQK